MENVKRKKSEKNVERPQKRSKVVKSPQLEKYQNLFLFFLTSTPITANEISIPS